ncbi:hypothetical protein DV736_g3147, partial [Chaetothyriales sp. CBS 134916]
MSQTRGRGGHFNNQIRNQSFQANQRNQPQSSSPVDLIQLAVKGWAAPPSKFAGNPESGINAIVTFLEKKSQRKIHSHKVIGKSYILFIDIDAADSQRFYHLDGFTFSGAPLTIEESRGRPSHHQHQSQPRDRTPLGPGQQNKQPHVPSGPRGHINDAPRGPRGAGQDPITSFNNQNGSFGSQSISPAFGSSSSINANANNSVFGQSHRISQAQDGPQQSSSEKLQLQDLMVRIIRKRYNPESRFLTFAELSKDPEIAPTPLVQSTAGKVWSAFFTVCSSQVFETAAKRREMVESISLANNELAEVKDVIALSATFPQLKNLDLSNNNISTAGDLRFWRNSFRSLEHLVLANNPIMSNPAEVQKLVRWWGRSLKLLNNEPVHHHNHHASAVNDGSMAIDGTTMMTTTTLKNHNTTATATPTTAIIANDNNISPSSSPVPFAGITSHPEVDVREFGQPRPGKSEEQMIKERMGLQFSVETHLKMRYVEMCLSANNFDYDKAMANMRDMWERGEVPADAFLGQ